MQLFLKGRGTREDPFVSKVRHVLTTLIRDPRTAVGHIIREHRGKVPNITQLRVSDLINGELAEAVTFRVALQPRKHGLNRAGTSIVEVQFEKGKLAEENRALFETALTGIQGVIEWDRIAGETDYLVRIAHPSDDDGAVEVVQKILRIPNVGSAFMSRTIQIQRSGIVDNFGPDHFLAIEADEESVQTETEQVSLR